MDFTCAAYGKLLGSLVDVGYRVVTVREYLQGARNPFTLVLRHDVEWNPRRALALADLEKARGVRSTFYFRMDTKAFCPTTMRYLQLEGFEIGYHFNTLDRCGGDFDKAITLFEEELWQLREMGINVDTVCSHGVPRIKKIGYKVNNEIFLRDPDLRSRNDLLGEAYLDVDFSSLQYLSDVGVRWNKVGSTNELISRIAQREWPILYILTHPDYWSRWHLRAAALQIAARSIRLFKINRVIIMGKQILGFPRDLMRGKRK